MGKKIPTFDRRKLEVPADIFYERLANKGERKLVEFFVGSVGQFMDTQPDPFLIAGVGGVLRYTNPASARDIDIAVVGNREDDLESFNQFVSDYFDKLRKDISDMGLSCEEAVNYDRGSGSTPTIKGATHGIWNRREGKQVFEGYTVADFSRTPDLAPWNSLGFQVAFRGTRGIDIQFVHKYSPKEWKDRQEGLQDEFLHFRKRSLSHNFPYVILNERG